MKSSKYSLCHVNLGWSQKIFCFNTSKQHISSSSFNLFPHTIDIQTTQHSANLSIFNFWFLFHKHFFRSRSLQPHKQKQQQNLHHYNFFRSPSSPEEPPLQVRFHRRQTPLLSNSTSLHSKNNNQASSSNTQPPSPELFSAISVWYEPRDTHIVSERGIRVAIWKRRCSLFCFCSLLLKCNISKKKRNCLFHFEFLILLPHVSLPVGACFFFKKNLASPLN